MLVLLIAIACGIFFICIQKTKEPLDTLSNQCPRGCVRATSITGKCKPYKKYKNQMIYACPSECRTPNINQQPGICSYDKDCASCKTSLIYSNGQPHRPGRAVPASPSSPPSLSPSPSPPPWGTLSTTSHSYRARIALNGWTRFHYDFSPSQHYGGWKK